VVLILNQRGSCGIPFWIAVGTRKATKSTGVACRVASNCCSFLVPLHHCLIRSHVSATFVRCQHVPYTSFRRCHTSEYPGSEPWLGHRLSSLGSVAAFLSRPDKRWDSILKWVMTAIVYVIYKSPFVILLLFDSVYLAVEKRHCINLESINHPIN
jgi:hypothetical protein